MEGTRLRVAVKSGGTVKDVKLELERLTRTKPQLQRLMFNNKEIKVSDRLIANCLRFLCVCSYLLTTLFSYTQ